MPSCKYYLKGNLIMCSLSFRRQRVRVSTGQKVESKLWNAKAQVVKTTDKYDPASLNHFLTTKKNSVLDAYRDEIQKGHLPNPEEVKIMLRKIFLPEKQSQGYLISFLTDFLSHKGSKYRKSTQSVYTTLKTHLEAYEQKSRKTLQFDSIGKDFYEKFTTYLLEAGLQPQSVGKYIKHIKVVMNEAFELGLHTNLEYRKKYFRVQRAEPDMIYLTEKEIQDMRDLKLSGSKEFYRDMFVLSCWTGLRFSDWDKYKPQNIVGGKLRVITQKGGKSVLIPLKPEAISIINKWKDRHIVKNQVFNREIKKIGREAKILGTVSVKSMNGGVLKTEVVDKCDLICSHTGRRSCLTNAFLSGVPTELIRRISGHRTEASFLRYIRIDNEVAADSLKEYKFFQ